MNIYDKLCVYDRRRDDNLCGETGIDATPNDCHCDNCFYGRTELAEQVINLTEQIERLEWDNRDKL